MTCLVVGLGNPGEIYKETRHNVGRLLLEKIAQVSFFGVTDFKWRVDSKFEGQISRFTYEGINFIWLLPDTYMNMSGRSVVKVMHDYNISPEQIIVLHDDLDLLVGNLKISFGKSSGGHNGVQSIIDHLKTKDFVRVRIGLAQTKSDHWWQALVRRKVKGGEFVLKRFSKTELEMLTQLERKVLVVLVSIMKDGREIAMTKFNA